MREGKGWRLTSLEGATIVLAACTYVGLRQVWRAIRNIENRIAPADFVPMSPTESRDYWERAGYGHRG